MRGGLRKWILTVGGLGRLPGARGTAGTIGGLAIYLAVRRFVTADPWLCPALGVLACGFLLVAWGRWAEMFFKKKDPPEIVLDEVAGIFLTFAGIASPTMAQLALGFVLFRAFDIVKPFPCRRCEMLAAGWGVLADDLVAAVYAALCLRGWIHWVG